jgi:hypothetical protein
MMSLLNGAWYIHVAISTNISVLRTSPPSRSSRDKKFKSHVPKPSIPILRQKVTICFFELYGIITFNNYFFHLGSKFGLTFQVYEKNRIWKPESRSQNGQIREAGSLDPRQAGGPPPRLASTFTIPNAECGMRNAKIYMVFREGAENSARGGRDPQRQ